MRVTINNLEGYLCKFFWAAYGIPLWIGFCLVSVGVIFSQSSRRRTRHRIRSEDGHTFCTVVRRVAHYPRTLP